MSIILKHILKNIKANKLRSIIIILSLILVSAIALITITMQDEIKDKYIKTLRKVMGKTDLIIFTDKNENINLDNFIFPEDAKYFSTLQAPIATKYKDDFKYVGLIGIDIKEALDFEVLKDKDIINLKDNELVLSKDAADFFKYKIGDNVTAFLENGEEAILRLAYIVEPEGIFCSETENELFYLVNRETASNLINAPKQEVNSIYLAVNNKDDIENVINKIDESNNIDGLEISKVIDEDIIKQAVDSIVEIFTIILIIVLIMIYFVVTGISKLIINERIPVIGTFRSIGATKRMVNLILILENAVYGLIGGSLGAVLGAIFKNKISGVFIVSNNLEIAQTGIKVNPIYILIVISFTIFLQILMSIFAIIRNSRKPIKDIIFNTQTDKYKISKIKVALGIISLAIAGVIYINNVNLNFIKSIIALCFIVLGTTFVLPAFLLLISKILKKLAALLKLPVFELACSNIANVKTLVNSSELISISLTLVILIYIFSTSLTDIFTGFSSTYKDVDIMIQNLSEPISKYNYIKDIEGVNEICALYLNGSSSTSVNDTDNVMLQFMPNNDADIVLKYSTGIKMNEELFKNLKDDEIILDSVMLDRLDLKIGDKIKIVLNKGNINEKTLNLKIIDDCNTLMFTTSRNMGLISFNTYLECFDDIPYSIWINSNLESNDMKEILQNRIKNFGVKIQTFDEYMQQQKNDNEGLLSMITTIIGLSVFLSFIGIVNNQIIGFMQRKREFAVIYSTSMSKGQIKRLIFIETLLSFAIAMVITISVSYPLIKCMERLLNGMYLSMPLLFNIREILMIAAGVLAIMLFSCITSMKRIRKMNIIEEIKCE